MLIYCNIYIYIYIYILHDGTSDISMPQKLQLTAGKVTSFMIITM